MGRKVRGGREEGKREKKELLLIMQSIPRSCTDKCREKRLFERKTYQHSSKKPFIPYTP